MFLRGTMIALMTLLLTTLSALAAPEIGQPAPAFTGRDTQGRTVKLDDFKGKIVVLEWTNHECPYVRKHYGSGNMQATQREAIGQGVVWLQVISSAPGEQGQVDAKTAERLNAERNAAPSATLLDPEGIIGRAYGAMVTPHMYVIDPTGKLVYMGAIDSIPTAKVEDIAQAVPYVKNALAAVKAGQPVAEPRTRAYGCTVKYKG